MGDDITITTALFQMVQRIEDKLDNVKDDLSSVKSKQAVIETTLQDHIDNTSHGKDEPKSGMDQAKSFILRYALPIALCLILIGRYSVSYVGNNSKIVAPENAPSAKIANDDTFIARNEAMDSIIRSTISKQLFK